MARANRVQFIIEVLDRASKQLGGIESRFTAFTRNITRLGSIVGLVITAAFSAQAFAQMADTMTLVENRIALVTDSTEELVLVQEKLFDVAQETRSSLASTVELYGRVARSVDVLGISQQEVIDLTETINKAIQISGATSQEAAAGVIQFAQGLASGALRGDELRSVLEQMPRLAEAISEGMGKTIGQLRELGTQGKLSAKAVIEALQGQSALIAEEFEDVAPTIGSAFQVLKNSVTDLTGDLSDATGASEGLASALIGVAEAVREVGDLIDDSTINRKDEIKAEMEAIRAGTPTLEGILSGIRDTVDQIRNPSAMRTAAETFGMTRMQELQAELDSIIAKEESLLGLANVVVPQLDTSKIEAFFDDWQEDGKKAIDKLAESFVDQFATSEQKIAKQLSDFRLVVKLRPEKFTAEDIARIEAEIKSQRTEGLEFFDLNAIRAKGKRISETFEDTFDEVREASIQAARSIQQAWADFFFDPFEDGIKGLLQSFINAVRRMVAELAASGLMDLLFGKDDGLGSKIAKVFGVFGRAAGGPGGPGQSVRVHDGEIVTFGPSGGNVTSVAAQRASAMGEVSFVTNIDARGADPSLIARMPKILEQRDRALMLKVKRYIETGSVPI